MKRSEICQTVEQIRLDLASVNDPQVKQGFVVLLNLVEGLVVENEKLREENEQLREENRRLKGEPNLPGVPRIKKPAKDVSSEKERKKRSQKPRAKRPDNRTFKDVQVQEEKICPVDCTNLPEDASFMGYEDVVVQDLKIAPHNIKFRQELYYSRSHDRWYRGLLPSGYQGQFGPHLKSLVIAMKYAGNMSEPKVLEFLRNFDVQISAGTVSNILAHSAELFHQEKADLYRAGLESTPYQQIDDTSAKVNGQNHHTQIVCNPYYTAYFTTPRKDRLTILDVLQDFAPRTYLFNDETFDLLERLRVPRKLMPPLEIAFPRNRLFNQSEMDERLPSLFPDPKRGKIHRQHILEASAIAAYHAQQDIPVVKILVCDDAGQFKVITDELALCWIHEGRHYQKLDPVLPLHQEKLVEFREQFWDFYGQLDEHLQSPSPERAQSLSEEFTSLFSTTTDYDQLDRRIAKTLAKKTELLTVLLHPEVPLHNNASELGARVSARRRDVSLHTKSKAGTRAMDTFTTIVQTAKKLGVNAYEYIFDRLSRTYQHPSLAELIRNRTHGPPEPCFPKVSILPKSTHSLSLAGG
jgi:hypothetical protein